MSHNSAILYDSRSEEVLAFPKSKRKASNKPHLAEAPDPTLKEGKTIYALCGVPVFQAKFRFMWDESWGKDWRQVIQWGQFCFDCLNTPISEAYVYGIYDGTEREK